MEGSEILLPTTGLTAGLILGYIARRNFFCTLSSLEQHWYAGKSDGLRTWVLAATVAIALTQSLSFVELFEPSRSFYLTPSFGWLGAVVGGWCFGFGMALIGTCGYGALVRLGGGSLKSLMAIMVLALAALSTQRGVLGLSRVGFFDQFQIDFSFAGDQSISSIASALTGLDLSVVVPMVTIIALLVWIFWDIDYRSNRRSILTGIIVGSVISAGWILTSMIAEMSFEPVQIESASFVAPVADTLLQFGMFTGSGPDYGVGLVIGTVLGSAIAARSAKDVRWEACDDARELSRHIMGATLMGFGGVLALGCTIGQGISAASLLAVSVPVSMFFIGLGARMGLAYLLEGSPLAPFRYQN